MEAFVACFADVTDPRQDNARHNLHEILMIALCTMLCRLALNLAKLEGSKGSMKGKLKRAGWNDAFLTQLLAAFGKAQMR
jgi:hypothetical protein